MKEEVRNLKETAAFLLIEGTLTDLGMGIISHQEEDFTEDEMNEIKDSLDNLEEAVKEIVSDSSEETKNALLENIRIFREEIDLGK